MRRSPLFNEALLLLAIIFVCLLYKVVLFPIFAGNSALDINQHDTYYTSPLHSILWIIIPLSCFLIYLFRAILSKFKNNSVLVILIMSTLFIIGWLSISGQSFNPAYFAQELVKREMGKQAKDNATVTGLFYGSDVSVTDYYSLAALQIALALFIGFIGIKIGRNRQEADTVKHS